MTTVKKLAVAGAAVAAILAVAGSANATVYAVTLVPNGDGSYSSSPPWGNHVTTSPFTDTANFILPTAGFITATLTTVLIGGQANINFTSVLLDGVTPFSLSPGSVDQATLTSGLLAAGAHSFTINGTLPGSAGASYGGVLNFTAVPEPATWAMMILGMGMIGAGMRMRRRARATYA